MADLSPELAAKIQSLEGGYADNPGRYFVALAGAWREAGEIGRAEEILRENLKRFPGLSAHVLLGRCLADRGAFQEAANEFHYVLSIDAQNLIALRTLAEMAAATGRRAEAERWYNELLAVDPMNAEARASLAELARGGADASVADQPVQVGTGWGGAGEPLPVAGGADADDGEFGMIDLDAPDASSADASGAAADDDADVEWGDLPLEMPGEPRPAAAAPAGDFDAFGFGSVELDGQSAGDDIDETGAVGDWLDADARQDVGESAATDRGGLAPLEGGLDDTLLDAPIAGAGPPFLDADDTVPADLPLLDAGGGPDFPGFDAPSHADDGFPAFSTSDSAALPAFGHGGADEHGERHDHADHDVDAEVVTETMAELYAAQGLLQQAADVYRELIQQRGEEPGLVRRLAEIEARMQPEEAAAAPADEEAPDWLASVDAFAMGGAAAGMAAIHMSAEPEPEPEAESIDAVEPPDAVFEPVGAAEPPDSVFGPVDSTFEPAAEPFDFEATFAEAPAPVDSSEGYTDAFADSFEGGFDGLDAGTPEPAFAAAAPAAGAGADEDRDPWEAPAVRESEPVGFDLIVVEENGDQVAAPPEVVADVSADWAIAAAPLEDDEEAAEDEAPFGGREPLAAPATSMRSYFAGLLAWQPGQSAAAPAAVEEPPFAAPTEERAASSTEPAAAEAEEDPWAEAPAAPAAPAASTTDEAPWSEAPASAAEEEPWAEAPAPPASDEAEEMPWAESPAAPAFEAPAHDLPAADASRPADEPWAAAAPEAAPRAGADDLPLMDLGDEPWAAPGAPEPASIDSFTLSDEVAPPAAGPAAAETDEEALPWELPAEPAAPQAEAAPEADVDGGFSFEDFFAGGPAAAEEVPAAIEPEPEPAREPELPPSFVPSLAFEPVAEPTPAGPQPPAAPAAPAASAPAGGQDEEDEDLESFQAWLQSLKR